LRGQLSILITGGAGFIGVNAAARFARAGHAVTVLDSLQRPGSATNLAWLSDGHPVEFVRADVRDAAALARAAGGQDVVVHLAGQVAVTTSLADPVADFEANAAGTLNLLEAVRRRAPEAVVLVASTNKVYGALPGRARPVDEAEPLDPRTPYGCSKAAADRYALEYHDAYGLRTVVLRQSCIYGRHQNGTEDQGWLAHFVRVILAGRPLTIYGDGGQVRDLLEVRDLCDLYAVAIERVEDCAGLALNVGGGPGNARSLLQVVAAIEALTGTRADCRYAAARPADQAYYVSDVGLAERRLGWRPRIGVDQGLADLLEAHAGLAR